MIASPFTLYHELNPEVLHFLETYLALHKSYFSFNYI